MWFDQLSCVDCHWGMNLIVIVGMIIFAYLFYARGDCIKTFGFCCSVIGANVIAIIFKSREKRCSLHDLQ